VAKHDDDENDARIDREAILARRRRFIAATLTGLTTSTLATACPCLKMAPSHPPPPDSEGEDGDAAEDASPQDGEIPEAVENDDEPEGDPLVIAEDGD